MDGTESLNGNLPSLPEILEGNRKKSQAYEKLLQACVENEKPTMETETIQRNFGRQGQKSSPKP